jgi:5-carboxymethyl-2-hydroxymuconate isomerase
MEYSANIADKKTMSQLLGELHHIVGATESVDIETVKSRLITHDIYFVGKDTSKRAFVHMSCSTLPGRQHELIYELGSRLHKKMVETVRGLLPTTINASITLEMRELNAPLFFRTPPP